MVRTITILWFCLITSYLPLPVNAATFCVSTSEALHDALREAENNNQDDQIRLQAGVYIRSSGLFTYISSQTDAIEILGGWRSNCTMDPDPSDPLVTQISGNLVTRALKVTSNGDVTISRIHFSHGIANVGGGLLLSSLNDGGLGDVLLERIVLSDNTATHSGSALWHSTGRTTTIRNSLFVQNTGTRVIDFKTNGAGLYFINNIVADNTDPGLAYCPEPSWF